MRTLSLAAKLLLGFGMAAVIAATFLWLSPAQGFRNAPLARILVFHVPNAMAAMLASVLSAVYGLIYLIKRRPADDIKAHAGAALALLFWLLTTLTGMVFAQVEWGKPWNWDPKQSGVFLVLLIYLSYFALRAGFVDEAKGGIVSAAWTLFAGILTPFLTFVIPNAPGISSLHPKKVIFSSDGMSPDYQIVFWSATFCLVGISIWLFRLRVAVDVLALDFRRRSLIGGKAG